MARSFSFTWATGPTVTSSHTSRVRTMSHSSTRPRSRKATKHEDFGHILKVFFFVEYQNSSHVLALTDIIYRSERLKKYPCRHIALPVKLQHQQQQQQQQQSQQPRQRQHSKAIKQKVNAINRF